MFLTPNDASGAQPLLDSPQMTPQQKIAMALMQSNSGQQQMNNNGAWSPAQGANQLFSSYMRGQMMSNLLKQQPQSQLPQSQVPQSAINQANMSSDPIAALNQSQNWTPTE